MVLIVSESFLQNIELWLNVCSNCIASLNTGSVLSHLSGRNDDFCVVLGPAIRTAGIVAEVG